MAKEKFGEMVAPGYSYEERVGKGIGRGENSKFETNVSYNYAIINRRQLFQKTSFISRQLSINAETNCVIAMIEREKGCRSARRNSLICPRTRRIACASRVECDG